MRRMIFLSSWILALVASATNVWGDDELVIDDIMWQDPPYEVPTLKFDSPPELIGLWTKALQRPDSELRRSAADTIAIAHRSGILDVAGIIEHLVAVLQASDQEVSVRRAAAHALVVMDVRAQAPLLAQVAVKDGLEVAEFVEPALAKWNYLPIREVWLRRLEDRALRPLWLLLAIRCLAVTKESAAQQPLLQLVHDRRGATNIRLAAAQTLAVISSDGLIADARQHTSDKSAGKAIERLLGMTLISGHSSQDAIALIQELAADAEPSVATAALTRLLDINPALTFDLAPTAVTNPDVNVRRHGAQALVSKADETSIRQLTRLLSDPNPKLRRWVAKSFLDLAARPELRNTVIAETERALTSDDWRGLEQAILLAVHLEQKNYANRMLELLQHSRPEVAVTAAWALRRFQLPETLTEMLNHAQRQYDRIRNKDTAPHVSQLIDGQHSQLFQAFGQLRFTDAEPLMRKFVPKNFSLGNESRAAACWALGYLHENRATPDLTQQFVGRLSDVESMMPEVEPVRRTCGVSLGRMKSTSALPVVRNFAASDGITSAVGQSCWWAIEQLSDDKRPPMPAITHRILSWFLQPAG